MATELATEGVPASEDGSESDSGLEVMFEDLLVTNEGEWVEAHRHNLLQLWNLLKQGKSRFNDNYLTACNFRIFCSFVYRWTEDENSDDEDSDDSDADMSSEDAENTEQEPDETVE